MERLTERAEVNKCPGIWVKEKFANDGLRTSGYASEMYDSILSQWKRVELESNDNTGRRRTEVVWMNYDIGQMELPIIRN